MSDSQPNLPKVPTLENLPAVMEEGARKTLMDVRWLLGLFVGGIAAIVAATSATIAFAQDAGTRAVEPVRAEVDTLKRQFAEHVKDDAQATRETKAVLSELGADIRALYRAQQTGRPQARLERPPQMPDGGP